MPKKKQSAQIAQKEAETERDNAKKAKAEAEKQKQSAQIEKTRAEIERDNATVASNR